MPRPFSTPMLAMAMAASVTLGCAMAGAMRQPDPAALNEAHRAYYYEQFARSLALYERLAEQGDAAAAERAGFMRLEGEQLYGTHVHRDLARAQALLTQAAKADRPGAAFLLNMIERSD
jgi:TPR repeat protein